jgi:hypothetical protein
MGGEFGNCTRLANNEIMCTCFDDYCNGKQFNFDHLNDNNKFDLDKRNDKQLNLDHFDDRKFIFVLSNGKKFIVVQPNGALSSLVSALIVVIFALISIAL